MNIFKKKSLCAALAGIGALGAVGAAQAVNLNPDGLGQVLIYPYYTTRTSPAGNVYNSLLSVVNSTASVKAVKVRFLEGKNSREVLDFNLFLSPKDVWTAGIVPMGAGAGIMTQDNSCTLPAIPAAGKAFVNFAYTADGAGSSLDLGLAALLLAAALLMRARRDLGAGLFVERPRCPAHDRLPGWRRIPRRDLVSAFVSVAAILVT